MDDKKSQFSCTNLILLFLVLAIGAGIERHSFWVGICIFFSLEFTALAFNQITAAGYLPFVLWGSAALSLEVLAYKLANYTPRVSWVEASLALIALAYIVIGYSLLGNKWFLSVLSFIAGYWVAANAFGSVEYDGSDEDFNWEWAKVERRHIEQEKYWDMGSGRRQAAARALGELRDARAVDPLAQCLKTHNTSSYDAYTWLLAIEALRKIGDPRAIKPLQEALQDYDKSIRDEAIASLSKLGVSPNSDPQSH